MKRLAAATGLATALVAAGPLASAPSRAQDTTEYVTVRDRLLCRTQEDLRSGLRAIEARDRARMNALDGCHFSIDGVPATVIHDNISALKIRLRADGQQADVWTVPETIRAVKRER